MKIALKFLSNPSVLIGLFAAGFIFWAVHTHNENLSLKHTVASQVETIQKMDKKMTELNENVKVIKGDQERLGVFMNSMNKTKTNETVVSKKLSAIPNTSTNKPFLNKDLEEAARIFRDYQLQEQNSGK
jgi:hypothetical protein